ncbi:MAG: TRAP transporter permease, partial [Beijerinckiaceae bacterium]
VITIPLMKNSGYRAPVAGAIEAVASTGGQIMPPIMGAAAFLMVELLGTSYQSVVVAALIPSGLYFLSVFVQADLEAAKHGIAPVPEDRIPKAGRVMKEGWYFILPFAVLLYALFAWNVQPEKAALYGLAAMVVLGLLLTYQGKRLTMRGLWDCLTDAGKSSVDIVVIGAAAGIILGILDRTGLSFGLTIILVELGGSSLMALLLMTAVIAIILGMGMPTTAIYFLLATLAAPPIIKLGVDPMAAHMFVLYFGMMSMITPPVALASFTAAKLADAPPMATAVASVRFGWPAFIIPFLFVLAPVLIMKGSPFAIAVAVVTAVAGIWITSGGLTGYLFGHLGMATRLGMIVSGVCLLLPSQTFASAWMFETGGAILAAILLGKQYATRPQPDMQPAR